MLGAALDGRSASTPGHSSCNCSKKCVLPSCECLANGLKCTDSYVQTVKL